MRKKEIMIIVAIVLIFFTIWVMNSQINNHVLQSDPKIDELRNIFEHFFSQNRPWNAPLDMLNGRDIMDEIDMYRGRKSYTLNKEKVFICLKSETGDYYNNNMLVYVTAHEISHALCRSVGHTHEFYKIFDALLKELTAHGIYNPYIPINTQYCMAGDSEIP